MMATDDFETAEEAADHALAHALWADDEVIREDRPGIHSYMSRAQRLRIFLRSRNHDVKCLECCFYQDHQR